MLSSDSRWSALSVNGTSPTSMDTIEASIAAAANTTTPIFFFCTFIIFRYTLPPNTAGQGVVFFIKKIHMLRIQMCKVCIQRPYINVTFSPAKELAQTQIKRDVLL